jgi:hypothetical protein
MRMKIPVEWQFLLVLSSVIFLGCDRTPRPPLVNISLRNDMFDTINGADVKWKGPSVHAGIMGPGTSKTTISVPWPLDQTTAIITFVHLETRERYFLEVSFADIAERVRAGQCDRIFFVILDYDRATVWCHY